MSLIDYSIKYLLYQRKYDYENNVKIVKLLIKHGANANAIGDDNYVLREIAEMDDIKTFEYIVTNCKLSDDVIKETFAGLSEGSEMFALLKSYSERESLNASIYDEPKPVYQPSIDGFGGIFGIP